MDVTAGKHRPATPYLNLVVASEPNAVSSAGGANAIQTHSRSASAAPPWVNENFLQSLVGQLYGPLTTTTAITIGNQTFAPGTYSVPQPTQLEFQRETFWAQFVGHYSVGAPRFSNQAATIHIFSNGRSVMSNQFLNGRAQILLFPPADPTAQPTTNDPAAGQVAGLFTTFPANVLQSSDSLFAQVTNLPGVASNDPSALDHGLPSHLQFLIDPGGVSGGMYSTPAFMTTPATLTNTATGQALPAAGGSGGAVAFNQGAGMIDIKYIPTNHLRAGASQSGTVIVRVQGLINTSGVLNALLQGGSISREELPDASAGSSATASPGTGIHGARSSKGSRPASCCRPPRRRQRLRRTRNRSAPPRRFSRSPTKPTWIPRPD